MVVKVPSQGVGIELLCAQFVNRNVGTIIVVGVGIFCHGGIVGLCAYPCVGGHKVFGCLSFFVKTVVRNYASYLAVDVSGSHHVILYERWGIILVDERYHAIGVVALASFNSTSEKVFLYCSAVYGAQHAARLILARLDARIREAVGNGATLIAVAHLGLRYFARDGSHVVASFNVRVQYSTVGNGGAIHLSYNAAYVGIALKVGTFNNKVFDGGVFGLAEEAHLALIAYVIF